MVEESLCLQLIAELEQVRQQVRARELCLQLPPGQVGEVAQDESGQLPDLLKWLRSTWAEAPAELLSRVPPITSGFTAEGLPFNRHVRRSVAKATRVVLHLFSGATKGHEFGGMPKGVYILNVDVRKGGNLLRDDVLCYLLSLAKSKKLSAIVGGPPCPTFSVLRDRAELSSEAGGDHGPRRLRAREGASRFALPDLTDQERKQAQEHNLLILRMMALYWVADQHSPGEVMFGLEHPADPCTYRRGTVAEGREGIRDRDQAQELRDPSAPPSLWVWPEIREMIQSGKFWLAEFHQSDFGHEKTKPTSLLVNSWSLYAQLHRHKNTYGKPEDKTLSLEERISRSRTWGKWAPKLVSIIGMAIREWLTQAPEQRQAKQQHDMAVVRGLLHGMSRSSSIIVKPTMQCSEGIARCVWKRP